MIEAARSRSASTRSGSSGAAARACQPAKAASSAAAPVRDSQEAGACHYTPHSGGSREFGFHWLVTLVTNCYLIAGLAFLAYMARRAYLVMTAAPPPLGPAGKGDEASLTGVRG
jgi:hypothetical protein